MPKKVALKVQNRTGFDKSFQNLLTLKCGTLVPLMIDEVIPNTTVSLRSAISASLPPLASDTFMRVQLRTEAFFVPFRLLYGGYEAWQTRMPIGPTGNQAVPALPFIGIADKLDTSPGSLSDYLGIKGFGTAWNTSGRMKISLLPYLAYHRIFDDWYRNPRIQQPLFFPYMSSNSRGQAYVEHLPYQAFASGGYSGVSNFTYLTFVDNVRIDALRQRNFDDDYFTSARPTPQQGPANSVSFQTDSQGNGAITISQIREANSLQQYAERNGILGYRLQDYNKGQYGADLKDGVAQRVLYLGSASFDVYSKGIYQTVASDPNAQTSQNPFDSVGASYGSAHAGGDFPLIRNFTANESGYIFVMVSLVPKVTYSTGIAPWLTRYCGGTGVDDRSDMANPILQNIGNAPIFAREFAYEATDNDIFGYTDRYAQFMTRYDELHGLLRDSSSLASFALQRSVDQAIAQNPQISSAFLRIPTTYLDQVSAVTVGASGFNCWVDSWLDYKVIQPLARYSIPSLQNPAEEHGHTVVVNDGGSHI